MKLIVGLGNPGNEYIGTRHNMGFMAIDAIAKKYNIELKETKFDGLYTSLIINKEKVIFLKPQKYMNLSGEVIKKYVDYFKININDILIIYDDMDLELGKFKIKYKGSSAGHNGLKNIEQNLKSNEYKRIKIGISKNKMDKINHVLGKFNNDELILLNNVLNLIPEIIENYLILTFDNLMNKYN